MKQKKTLVEELRQIGDWFYERDLGVGDVVRRVVAVAAAMLGGSIALVVWTLALEAFGMAVAGGGFGWVIGGVAISGVALLATCGVAWMVWALWTDEL